MCGSDWHAVAWDLMSRVSVELLMQTPDYQELVGDILESMADTIAFIRCAFSISLATLFNWA